MSKINNQFYDDLSDDWYLRNDHPIALLRQENKVRNPWIEKTLNEEFPNQRLKVLDIGCGAGFLTNTLSHQHDVYGIDLSIESLEVAKRFDREKRATYLNQSALDLQFPESTFDAVFAMDLLEHVEDPKKVIEEASRVLKPNGIFFFHTFNRNLLSYLLVIKGVDIFVPNAPKNMHVYSLFIKPQEIKSYLVQHALKPESIVGLRPKIFSKGTLNLLKTKSIDSEFEFKISKSLLTGYMGFARSIKD